MKKFDISALPLGGFVFILIWFVMDRTPPYIRESGEMVPLDPSVCGIDHDSPQGLTPGACVGPVWQVRSVRQCEPAPGYPVSRWLIQSTGNRVSIGTAKSEWAEQGKNVSPGNAGTLKRNFVLPYTTPEGLTEYEVDACFTCNPLQRLFPSKLAVCVSEPRIQFTVTKPAGSGPTGALR